MSKRFQWMVFLAALVTLIAVYFITQQMIESYANRPLPIKEVQLISPEVSVITVTPGSYQRFWCH